MTFITAEQGRCRRQDSSRMLTAVFGRLTGTHHTAVLPVHAGTLQ